MATENRGTLIMIKMAKEIREQGHDQDEQRKEKRDDQDQDDQRAHMGMIKMSKEKRGVMIKIKMIKEHLGMMIKIKTIKENRSTTTMIMSKMIKENRSMTVKEASRDLSQPGMQRRSPTMWWRKRDGNIIRIFFWGEIQGFVLIKVDISWRGTGHHTVQNTLHFSKLD